MADELSPQIHAHAITSSQPRLARPVSDADDDGGARAARDVLGIPEATIGSCLAVTTYNS